MIFNLKKIHFFDKERKKWNVEVEKKSRIRIFLIREIIIIIIIIIILLI